MPSISLPFNIEDDDDIDAGPVMGNFESITSTVNGSLELGANVLASAPPSPITGKDDTPGVSTSALRADAQFVLQGMENATDLPSSGNFLGRLVYITANTNIGKLFMCVSTAGVGTWQAIGNQGAADVAIHAAQHEVGGHDPIPAGGIAASMRGVQTPQTAILASDSAQFSGSGWTNLGLQLVTAVTTVAQTYAVWVDLVLQNTGGSNRNAAFRVQDVGTSTTTTVHMSKPIEVDIGVQTQVTGFFYYTPPDGTARTIRVQGACSAASSVLAKQPAGFNTETFLSPNLVMGIA